MKTINRYIVLFIGLVCLSYSARVNWSEDQWPGIIQSDGKGYYAYLPAVLIYHDLNFDFFGQTEIADSYDKNRFFDYRAYHKGKTLNKYTAGTAFCILPFFLLAHVLTVFSGLQIDGYSQLYAVFVSIAAIAYLMLGLFYLKKLFALYDIKGLLASFLLISIVFGTNLFYYTIGEPSMSHVYSFAFVSIFLFYLKHYFRKPNPFDLIASTLAIGFIILIRPANIILLGAIPFLAGSFQSFLAGIRAKRHMKTEVILAAISMILIISIQLIIYKIQAGAFFIDTYPGENFNFLKPHFIQILFSYKKGLFLYTPLLLVSLLGFIYLFRRSKFEAVALFLFLLFITFVLSSWWNWWYGGSFSSRVYVEYLPFFALLLGFSFTLLSRIRYRIILGSVVFLLILACQVQTLQYRYLHIHWSEMNKKKYRESFLRIDRIILKKMSSS
ncbi:MAG: hypothetical protein KAG99_09345, partial [Bacteroidales bacterium]|nr:hypothetical protein [Bacteroidales bacterium]